MFAVLQIPDFALQAVLCTEAGTAGRPAALFSSTGKKSVALSVNAVARHAGVAAGMSAPQAVARCPGLLIRSPVPAAEADARAALLAVGFMLSPVIEDTAPGICTADLKGGRSDPETPAAAALSQLGELGLPATAGMGRTPLLALYAARSGGGPGLRDDAPFALVSEPAGDYLTGRPGAAPASRPPVFTVVDENAFLGPLPLATADPAPDLAAVLMNWGLRTLGDLTQLPRDDIIRRFGSEGLRLWQRATGGAPRPLHPVVPAQSFTAAREFEDPVETLEPLLFILRRFLDRLTLELRASQHVAAEMALALRLEDDTQQARSFRLPEPTADPDILFRTLHTYLESLQTPAAITALDLHLTPARPLVRQQGLFDTGLRDPHGFAETLARVGALVGADRVGTPQPVDTHRPDTVVLAPPPPTVPAPAEPTVHPPLGLPLRRFRPPLPATIEFTAEQRKPTYVATAAFQGEIAAVRGPWRSSGDWWQQDRAWARMEWDIALAAGGLYRLLRIDDAWYIEGEYD
jgi:protein ImuB